MFDTTTTTTATIRVDLTAVRSLCAEARRLIASGADPDAIVHAHRGETLCFEPRPLRFWAERMVVEGDRHSAQFTRYTPAPWQRG